MLVWSELEGFNCLTNVRFYFGDERCVPPDHPESNYGLVMQTLFKNGVPSGCTVFRMQANEVDQAAAAFRYGQLIPSSIDVILFGVGDDGHIASLFPGSEALHESSQKVVPIVGPKPPCNRLTITPSVITLAKFVFVFAPGIAKAEVLRKALLAPDDFDTLPARLVLHAAWLVDEDASLFGTECAPC